MGSISFVWIALAAAAPQSGLVTEEGKLYPEFPSLFGTSGAAVSIEGDTAVVGEPGANGIPYIVNNDGAVHVFVRSGTGWTRQARLRASDAESDDNFGASVCLSGDLLAVGAPHGNPNFYYAPDSGAVYVFSRNGTTWSEVAKVAPLHPTVFGNFGRSLALEGDTLLVGDPNTGTTAFSDEGAAFVFVREGTTWTQQARLTASDLQPEDHFGFDVALNRSVAVVGAPFDEVTPGAVGGTGPGSAYVFVRQGADWNEVAKLSADDAQSDDRFGAAVAIDGRTALIGANQDVHAHGAAGGPTGEGAAYAFAPAGGGTWTQRAKVVAGDTATGASFGVSVALEGDLALIGQADSLVPSYGWDEGAAHLFRRSGTNWIQLRRIQATGSFSDDFGYAVDLSGDTALIGARHDNEQVQGGGAAYVFRGASPGVER
jgi:hypothetical protein